MMFFDGGEDFFASLKNWEKRIFSTLFLLGSLSPIKIEASQPPIDKSPHTNSNHVFFCA